METEHNAIIEEYAQGAMVLRNAFMAYPKESWDYKPEPKAWSLREILAHLADHELHVSTRLRYIVAEPGTEITMYAQDAWADKLGYNKAHPARMLDLTTLLREWNTEILQSLVPSQWDNTLVHPEAGPMTLFQFLPRQQKHLQVHLRQMERTYLAWLKR